MALHQAFWIVGALMMASAPLSAADTGNEVTAGQIEAVQPNASVQPKKLSPPDKNPYKNLFRPPVRGSKHPALPNQPPDTPAVREPRVVCGMLIIPADPRVDPGIRLPVPDSRTEFEIRVLKPPICQPE